MDEKRRHKRVSLDRSVTITLSSGTSVTAKLVNISEKGISILYGAPADVGAILNFQFTIPVKSEVQKINLNGVVKHSHFKGTSYYIGVEYQELSDENFKLINSFINYRLMG